MPPACCEKSPCALACKCMPCLNLPYLSEHRRATCRVLIALHVVAIAFAIFATLGNLTGKSLKTTYWSYVDVTNAYESADETTDAGELYVGFKGVYSDGGILGNEYYTWDAFDDELQSSKAEDTMDSCADAAGGMVSTSIIAAVTLLPTINTLMIRSDASTDSPCNKFASVLPSIMGSIATIATTATFSKECFQALPSSIYVNGVKAADLDKKLGVGYFLEIMVAVVGITTGLIMLFLGVPPAGGAAGDAEAPAFELKTPEKAPPPPPDAPDALVVYAEENKDEPDEEEVLASQSSVCNCTC